MILHPYMVHAIYLRMHPGDIIQSEDGRRFWYNVILDGYFWISPKEPDNIHSATGLESWWFRYLIALEEAEKPCEVEKEYSLLDEELPY